jgi:fibronectin-binding autotransporter adhesin
MPTITNRGTVMYGVGGNSGFVWAATASAVDGTPPTNPATYATCTSAVSNGEDWIMIKGFGFGAAIPSDATLTALSIGVRYLVSSNTRWSNMGVECVYQTSTPAMTRINSTAGALSAVAATQSFDALAGGVTLVELRDVDFRVNLYVKRAAVTQSAVFSIDHIDITATYSAPAGADQTWTGDVATIGGAGTSGVFVAGGASWLASVATLGLSGVTTALWIETETPQTWAGSVAELGVAAISDAFSGTVIGGRLTENGGPRVTEDAAPRLLEELPALPQTWTGSTTTLGVTVTAGAFIAGDALWSGSTATVGVAGTSGVFIAGASSWLGGLATIGIAALTGTMTAGALTWAGSTATVGVAGTTDVMTAGPATWTGSVATAGVAGSSGSFGAGGQAWPGSVGTIGVATVSGSFTAGAVTWVSTSIATVGVAGVTDVFVVGTVTWVGSSSTIGVAGQSGAWTGAGPPQDWGGPGPPQLSVTAGLDVWLDASQLALADGAYVDTWTSLSNPALVGTNFNVAPYRPVMRTNGLNGLPVVRFAPGGGLRWPMSELSGETGLNWSIVYVGRMWDTATQGRVVSAGYPPTNVALGYHGGFEDKAYVEGWLLPDVSHAQTTNWKLYTGTSEGVIGLVKAWFYSDGVFLSGDHAVTGGWGGSTFHLNGYSPTSGEETCNCEIAELLFYDHRLTDVDRNAAENYLRSKWLQAPVAQSDIATIAVSGTSGVFTAGGQGWSGSIATVGVAGVSGTFTAGAATWTGSTATVGMAATSGAFTAGTTTWTGSIATVGAAGSSGAWTAGGQAWTGSVATVGTAGTSGAWIAGARTWAGSIATVGVYSFSGTWAAGTNVWIGSVATVGVKATSGTFVSTYVSIGNVARVGVAGQTGTWSQTIIGGKPNVWMGSTWVAKPVKYWNGSAWVAKPMKVWTGSQWELV